MKLRLAVAALVLNLSINGCAPERTMIPPGYDPRALADEIAIKGQAEPSEDAPDPPQHPIPPVVEKGLVIATKVGATCVVLSIAMALAIAAHGQSPGFSCFDGCLNRIWAAN